MRQTRNQSFDERYPGNGARVLSSIGKVGAAGRSGDLAKIAAERDHHRKLMASLP